SRLRSAPGGGGPAWSRWCCCWSAPWRPGWWGRTGRRAANRAQAPAGRSAGRSRWGPRGRPGAPRRARPGPPRAGRRPSPAVAAPMAGPLGARRLGPRGSATVIDLATGSTLYDANGSRPAAPASTTKLTTAVAVLASYPADHRFRTRVVAGARPGQVVLVGGGDPTLSAAPAGTPSTYPGAARLAGLAAAVPRSGAPPASVAGGG